MNTEMLETVLNEILNEQKEANKLNHQVNNKMNHLSGKIDNLETGVNYRQMDTTPFDTKAIHEIVTEGVGSIKQVVAAQPKNVIHQKQITIFPEFKSPECYRLLFKFVLYIVIATYGFIVIKVIVDHWSK